MGTVGKHVAPDRALPAAAASTSLLCVSGCVIREARIDDAEAIVDVHILGSVVPDGYGPSGFQAASLIFPTAGCWCVSGRVDGRSLEFVVRVIDASGQ